MVLNHIPHLKVDLGQKIARFYRAGRRLYGEVFALPADFQMLSSQLVYRFFTITRTFLLPLKLFSASVLKLFHFCEDNEGWELSHRYYRYRNDSTPHLFQ